MRPAPLALLLVLAAAPVAAAEADSLPAGERILRRVDANIGSDSKISEATMTIHGRRGSRTVRSRSWIQGMARSFTEYLDPPRERGVKMLKLGDELWTYSPTTDRTIRISGHMLRQSVMGSDLSYEDLMEDPVLHNLYTATVAGRDTLAGRACWVLDLDARREGLAYHRRRVWVDRERDVMLREDRFARSGRLLKTTEVREVERIAGRWVPVLVVFRDVLGGGEGTEFRIESITFDADIPGHLFSKAALRR